MVKFSQDLDVDRKIRMRESPAGSRGKKNRGPSGGGTGGGEGFRCLYKSVVPAEPLGS